MDNQKYALIDEAIAGLERELPVIFARRNVGKLLGGAIAPGTLANLAKNGPPYFFIGRNAVLERKSFLSWLKTVMHSSQNLHEIIHISHK